MSVNLQKTKKLFINPFQHIVTHDLTQPKLYKSYRYSSIKINNKKVLIKRDKGDWIFVKYI